MLNKQLLSPKSIAVIGASNDVSKPGGKILLNLQEHKYKGKLYAVNPRDPEIQGIKTFATVDELPMIDLAILAIPAKLCPQTIDVLANAKKTKAFIVISAGFSEESEQGAEWERQMVETVKSVDGVLIGPNCIGVLTPEYSPVRSERMRLCEWFRRYRRIHHGIRHPERIAFCQRILGRKLGPDWCRRSAGVLGQELQS